MPEQYSLRISNIAEADLASIYEYGFRQWGEWQADQYYDALISHLDQLCANPFLYAAVDHIRPAIEEAFAAAIVSTIGSTSGQSKSWL